MIEIKVRDYQGSDRIVREVTLHHGGKQLKRFGFSANWQPHNFAVSEGSAGWDAVLSYNVGNQEEYRELLFDFDCDSRLRELIRDFLAKRVGYSELRDAVR